MYCTHCAKKINEAKLEKAKPSLSLAEETTGSTKIAYVCPRCGHLVHADISEEEIKSLSRASHAQIQRARNFFASGMGMVSVGVIALIIAILFFFLAKKPANQYQLVVTCAEFYVFVILLTISVILLGVGGGLVITGIHRSRANHALLQDINNQTFVQ